MRAPRCVTALLMTDPAPDREERAEALRLSLPEPRQEQPLSEWLAVDQPAAKQNDGAWQSPPTSSLASSPTSPT